MSGRASDVDYFCQNNHASPTNNTILDWLRPRLTITTTGVFINRVPVETVLLLVKDHKEEVMPVDIGRREKRKVKRVGLNIAALNLGPMTDKGREQADMIQEGRCIMCARDQVEGQQGS